jgi:hypothetical protein
VRPLRTFEKLRLLEVSLGPANAATKQRAARSHSNLLLLARDTEVRRHRADNFEIE